MRLHRGAIFERAIGVFAGRLESDSGQRRSVAAIAALFAAIAVTRFAVPNDIAGISFLYVIPISLLAIEFGYRGGLIGASIGALLLLIWRALQDAPHAMVEFPIRAIVFVLVGILVGAQSERRRKLEFQRDALITELRAMATEDSLTGLPNRRAWEERFVRELQRARRSAEPLAVVAIDLDNLKSVNDREGHSAGDMFIVACAADWRRATRSTDFVARLGGDEFLALLPNSDAAAASAVAERALASGESGRRFSAGIAVWDGHESGQKLLMRADAALYQAKREGEAAIAIAQPESSSG